MRRRRQRRNTGLQRQRFTHREERIEDQLLRHDAKVAARFAIVADRVKTHDPGDTAIGAGEPGEDADQRGLAGAIRPQQRENSPCSARSETWLSARTFGNDLQTSTTSTAAQAEAVVTAQTFWTASNFIWRRLASRCGPVRTATLHRKRRQAPPAWRSGRPRGIARAGLALERRNQRQPAESTCVTPETSMRSTPLASTEKPSHKGVGIGEGEFTDELHDDGLCPTCSWPATASPMHPRPGRAPRC